MLEILLAISFLGLFLASRRRMGAANPFFIYFLVWSLVFFGYYISIETFIPVAPAFVLMLIAASAFSLLILFMVYAKISKFGIIKKVDSKIYFNKSLLRVLFLACVISVPFTYLKANELSGGVDIFTVLGYIYLRSAMTEEGRGFGVLTYFSILSYVISSIYIYAYCSEKSSAKQLAFTALSILISVFYVYVNTARTGVLLLLLLLVLPLYIRGYIGLRGAGISGIVLVCMFFVIAIMTAKGASSESTISENILSLGDNLRGYTIAPLLAFSQLEKSFDGLELGANSFRLFFLVMNSLGISEISTLTSVREYVYVPDPTNVYTVYDPYFRDFSYLGVFIPPLFMVIHWSLYRRSYKHGGIWIFLYSASVYPLAMQFFADQYISLLSLWVQLIFWYWLLITKESPVAVNARSVLVKEIL